MLTLYKLYPTIQIDNFLSALEIENIAELVYNNHYEKTELIDKWGVWKGHLVTTQYWVAEDTLHDVFAPVYAKLQNILEEDFVIEKGQILHSHLAYDVHTDYYIKVDHEAEELVGEPYYTLVIPFEDTNSSTVVFEQSADYNDFYIYKEKNTPIENCMSQEEWDKHCSHCWAEDRNYLTLDTVANWKQGKLIAFDRKRYHCSDNFTPHVDVKKAFVLWVRHA